MRATSLTAVIVALLLCAVLAAATDRSFVISGDEFVKDSKPFRIISGAFHYFRTPPELWRDRLERMRLGGLNTVETYVPWNLHEPVRGTYDFSGGLDIVAFLKAAADIGLLAIVRPPPYICAEFEWGGLPSWLVGTGAHVRCNDPLFLQATDAFLERLGTEIAALQYARGGNIIAIQVENEYGSYGSDKNYLQHLQDTLRNVSRFDSAVLFSSNGWEDEQLRNGATDSVLRTVNFGAGTDVPKAMAALRRFQPHGPLFCTELWLGWFDHWSEKHHTVSPASAAATLDALLKINASVNVYMYVGGTNWGFLAGANAGSGAEIEPDVTSYDYDAPVAEDGDCGEKWKRLKETIARYAPVPTGTPASNAKTAYGKVTLLPVGNLLNASFLATLSKPVTSAEPLSFAALNQAYGFVLYETTVLRPVSNAKLIIAALRDRALVYVDGEYVGVLTANNASSGALTITNHKASFSLQLLVENMGRVNFGSAVAQQDKGILAGGVLLGSVHLSPWTHWPLPLSVPPSAVSGAAATVMAVNRMPVFFHGGFVVAGAPTDTFLDMQGHTKGVAFVNGRNLGRFWNVGPQRTLYVPAPFLKQGTNTVDILELDATSSSTATVSFVAAPLL